MCGYVHVCVCVCIFVCVCVCVCVWVCACMCRYVRACVGMCVYVCVWGGGWVCACMHVCHGKSCPLHYNITVLTLYISALHVMMFKNSQKDIEVHKCSSKNVHVSTTGVSVVTQCHVSVSLSS